MEDLLQLPIKDIHEKLVGKQISAKELVELCLGRIDERDKDLNAFITPTPELALKQAAEIDKKIARNEEIPLLAGIPCSIKDSILVEGVVSTAGSRILENYVAPYNATVTQRLLTQGCAIVGKTNMDEFSMGASTENSAFGPTKNPHDTSRVAGGSSGGAAASVAALQALVALGEDTGGSIRLPASFCGVAGLKPTYGAVSRHGVVALASSLDQVGPFGKTVEDAEIVFNVIKGKDPLDSTSVESQSQKPKAKSQKLRIGVPKEYFGKGLDPQVEEVIKNALQKFEDAGAHLEEITLPHTKYALAAYYLINTSEASANLARYDGMRYGYSKIRNPKSEIRNLLDVYLKNRGEGLGPEVKRRIMLGTYALSAGYYEAYYLKAQKIRTLLKQDFDAAFEKVDVIMGPVSPFLPFKIGEKVENPLAMYLVDIYTVPVNLVGLPGLSVPAGKAGGLPVGLQIIGKPFEEDFLFAAGKTFEKLV